MFLKYLDWAIQFIRLQIRHQVTLTARFCSNLLLRRSDWQTQSSELLALSSRNLYGPELAREKIFHQQIITQIKVGNIIGPYHWLQPNLKLFDATQKNKHQCPTFKGTCFSDPH